MLLITDLLIASLIALLVTATVYGCGWKRSQVSGFQFFVVVLLASWAGGIWILPKGPVLGGTFIFPALTTGCVVGLALMVPSVLRGTEEEPEPQRKQSRLLGWGSYYWIVSLLLALLAALAFLV